MFRNLPLNYDLTFAIFDMRGLKTSLFPAYQVKKIRRLFEQILYEIQQ